MIKYGKPILELEYNKLKYIALGGVLVSISIIIYCIVVFNSAIGIKTDVGNYINLVSDNDGNTLPLLLAFPALLCLPLNVFSIYLIYSAFAETKRATLNTAMYTFIMVCIGVVCITLIICIMVLTHSYSAHEKLHDGITDAMQNYSSNSVFKTRVDMLQLQFQCCGSKDYKEWYDIEWYDTNFNKKSSSSSRRASSNSSSNATETPTEVQAAAAPSAAASQPVAASSHRQSSQTPFSCCSMKSIYPCIHHNIESTSLPYRYSPESNFSLSTHGCFTAIKNEKKSVGWRIIRKILMIVLLQLTMIAMLRFIQTAHFENSCIIEDDSTYTSWLIGCYVKKSPDSPPPIPPVPTELMD